MDDQTITADHQSDPACSWCSAALIDDPAICPSCGAILTSDKEQDLPGLTTVDVKAASGQSRPAARSRLLSWISGQYPEAVPTQAEIKADAHALAPPDPAVQREILRLEIEAEIATLQAEADSIRADALVEGRVVGPAEGGVADLGDDPVADPAEAEVVGPAEAEDQVVEPAEDEVVDPAEAEDELVDLASDEVVDPAEGTAADKVPESEALVGPTPA